MELLCPEPVCRECETAPSRFAVATSALRRMRPVDCHGYAGPLVAIASATRLPKVTSPTAANRSGRTSTVPRVIASSLDEAVTRWTPGRASTERTKKRPSSPTVVEWIVPAPRFTSITVPGSAVPRTVSVTPGASHVGRSVSS